MYRYLHSTKDLKLILESDGTDTIHWWVDADLGVHHDMKSHTGGMLSLGKGAVYSASTKQKLNTKSSTESKSVGIDDLMPQIIWTRLFLEAQGFVVRTNILYHDNQRTIKLANNGWASSGKRTRYLNIRYYFVTDRIAKDDKKVEHYTTSEMIVDFFTKSLQGKTFKKFLCYIMNIEEDHPALILA